MPPNGSTEPQDDSVPARDLSISLLPELLLTLLFGAQASFTHPGIILPQKENLGDAELREVIKKTQKSREAREILGLSSRIWETLSETLRAGNDQLATNKYSLVPRVRDLVILARNLLATKEQAQNLAADSGLEAEVRRLLDICVEKASKPIAPSLDKQKHDTEMHIKSNYKKVLVTTLQFLNNLISQNEARKLHLWLHMFGTPSSSAPPCLAASPGTTPKPKTNSGNGSRPRSDSGAGTIGAPTGTGAKETVAKCSFLASGFNAKYYKPGFLTEVPRLLQPDEIQPLPMMIQNGVVSLVGTDYAMQSVRCKLMLAQGFGRSLLREILVFLGAWEVDEDDFCFKMMVQVVEAILNNGLIPYTYECFKDDKDIVTPAQAVLMKLLAAVYRQPETERHRPPTSLKPTLVPPPVITACPEQIDAHGELSDPRPIVTSIPIFFVGVLRKQVLPPTIKIIQLQGSIRGGAITKDSFEFSLWDLDRIYEGLYQFFDLLVLFSENEGTKNSLLTSDNGLVTDLVEFLIEADKAIPRWIASKPTPAPTLPSQAEPPAKEDEKSSSGSPVKSDETYLVERPFDVPSLSPYGDEEYDDSDSDDPHDDRGLSEPEDFTWPHIKRYVVMLLSSFSLRNKAVQDLVREGGGLQAVLNQCMIDDDNPYIREHAILCIRNLLEGNLESQKLVKELEAVQVVPSEVLDSHGYEHSIDESGRVQLAKIGGDDATAK